MMKLIRTLGNRKAGFIITFAFIINLAIGSLVMNYNKEIYPPFFDFNLNFFFSPIRPVHFWLYFLFVTGSFFSGNMFFSTLESIVSIIKRTMGKPKNIVISDRNIMRSFAAVFIHAAILISLAAHLADGFLGKSTSAIIKNNNEDNKIVLEFLDINNIEIISVDEIKYNTGQLKDIVGKVKIHDYKNKISEQTISYNSPALFNFATKIILIKERASFVKKIVLVNKKNKKIFFPIGEEVKITEGSLEFTGIKKTPMGFSVANFIWKKNNGQPERKFIITGKSAPMHRELEINDDSYQVDSLEESQGFFAQLVYNPSIPAVTLGLFISVLGLICMFLLCSSKPKSK